MTTQPNIEIVTDDDRTEGGDWLDGALGILAAGDFITPGMSLARGGARLAIPRGEAIEAAAILKAARIASWSWQASGDYMLLDVPRDRARDACKLLGLDYQKPPSAWSGRVLLVLALGSGLLLPWFIFAMLTVGGVLR